MKKLTAKLNALFQAYKLSTKEDEKNSLECLMEETIKEIANFIIDSEPVIVK